MCRMCEMLHADPVHQNYQQMGEWWENNTCKLVVRYVNPFLFIRGLSCPSCIQASLSLNCLKLTIPGFPHNCLLASCGDIGFLKNPRSSLGLEIRPLSAFSAFRALLPSANYSAEWSGRVWQPSADSNGLFAHHYCQQRAVTPYSERLNSNKKGAKLSLLSTEGCHTQMDWQHCPLITYQKPSDDINSCLFLMNKKGLKRICMFYRRQIQESARLK